MHTSKTCFFIDDDDDDRDFFCTAINSIDADMECRFAKDGIDALKQLNDNESFIPDNIFIDMNMPLMDGKQCLEEIKKLTRLNNSNVYIYSTAGSPKLIEEILSLGATDFLIKPSNMNDLKQMLKKAVCD